MPPGRARSTGPTPGAILNQLLALTGHLLHSLVLVGGLAGMAAILAPGVAQRAGLLRPPDSPIDRRLADLRGRAAAGTLAARTGGRPEEPGALPRASSGRSGEHRVGDPLLAAAVVGSAAAAGVHAAVGPMHLADYPLLAAGFLVAAVLQATWPLAVLAPARTDPAAGADAATRLALAGLAVQGGCLAAWAVSRTVGLPAFLHGAGAQPVGVWDLAAVGWQLVAAAWCVAHLAGRRHASDTGGAPQPGWGGRGVRRFLLGSALVLVLLTMSGASA